MSSYTVEFRPTGTSAWTTSTSLAGTLSYLITGLLPASSYDILVQAQSAAGAGLPSGILTVVTSAVSVSTIPGQVTGLTATATTSSAVQLSWSGQTGATAATNFAVNYRVTGTTAWTTPATGIVGTSSAVSGLVAATSYDFEVIGTNAAGTGPASAVVSASTLAATQSVTSITWNVLPAGPYTAGSGTIGVNAHVLPATSPIQFGVSLSSTTHPTSWTAAALVNTDLWGAYLPVPSSTGTYYVWAEGLDGSAATTGSTTFVVQ